MRVNSHPGTDVVDSVTDPKGSSQGDAKSSSLAFIAKIMPALKSVGRWLLIFFLMLAHLGVAQWVFFVKVILSPYTLEEADLIASFQGRYERTLAAYQLADLAYAPAVVISPATNRQLKEYEQRFQPEKQFERILETNARTTFENALYVREIIKENDFNKVILVTSWDHMPRSYLLLKMMLIGSDADIQTLHVPTGNLTRHNWYRSTVGWKMVYNEMVETWGSLIEHTSFHINGVPSGKQKGKSAVFRWLKKNLLFEVDLKTIAVDDEQ